MTLSTGVARAELEAQDTNNDGRPDRWVELEQDCLPALTVEFPATYVVCSGCGQHVLRDRALTVLCRHYCSQCHKLLKAGRNGGKLH